MREPIMHQQTELLLTQHIATPSQSLLLVGQEGSGKLYLAQWTTHKLKLDTVIVAVLESKQNIGIEQIQTLYQHTKTGRPLCIIIEDAHLMTRDAQNALLKLLEEPPENTYFILTSINEHKLLQTIRSRCLIVPVRPVSDSVLLEEFSNSTIKDLLALIKTSGGKLGTLMKLIEDTDTHDAHKTIVNAAKHFYGSSCYERLALVQSNGFEKKWATELLDMLAIIIDSLIHASAADASRLHRLRSQASSIEQTAQALQVAGNPKIHLTRLALAL